MRLSPTTSRISVIASVTTWIVVLAGARWGIADVTIKTNPFAVAPSTAETVPSTDEDSKARHPSRICATVPRESSSQSQGNQQEQTWPADWALNSADGQQQVLPDGWLPEAVSDEGQPLPENWLATSETGDDPAVVKNKPRPQRIAHPNASESTSQGDQAVDAGQNSTVGPTGEPTGDETAASETVGDETAATPADSSPRTAQVTQPETSSRMDWWNVGVDQSLLDRPRWVKFDLETVLLDTLQNSPRIKAVSRRSSIAAERITQQDAAFDPTLLFDVQGGQTNDPVGNTLTTGGADRLREKSFALNAGVQRTGRHGTTVSLSQQLGLLDSNSTFFEPDNQGDSRLSLSLTQPLLARGDQFYNERLLTQARIDNRVAWQDMRNAVERRIAEVISAYWQLYELRCQLMQQRQLLQRARYIEQVISGRAQFDASRIELAKAQQRVARRYDRLIELAAELKKQQARLAALIGSDALYSAESQLEMIPLGTPNFPDVDWDLRDAVARGLENRPEVKAAAGELESAALSVQVTRAELVPQLNAVINGYLAALNGDFGIGQSYVDQFSDGAPGFSGAIEFEMPRGRRAARSAHREAHHRYHQKSEELKEAIQRTRWEIETALIDVRRAAAQKRSKQHLLITATEEETALTRRWELMAGDGGRVGVVLENLLDAQQRRTDAEREWVTTQSDYLIALVELQRAMGTLLITEAISPVRARGDCAIEFVRGQPAFQRGQSRLDQQPQADSNPYAVPVPTQSDVYGQFLNNLQQDSVVAPQNLEK